MDGNMVLLNITLNLILNITNNKTYIIFYNRATIDHNAAWDACWLTLFTRSRKHSKTFDWSELHAQFFIKARELMKLPTGKGRSPQESEYPHNFPPYYSILISLSSENGNSDPRKIALCKISKIIYFISLQQSVSITKFIQVEPISITPSKQLASGSNPPSIIGYNIGKDYYYLISIINFFLFYY
jgi:hypothetical protein